MDPIVTSRLSLASIALHEATDADLEYATQQITQLSEEASSLGAVTSAAPVHHAMGRVFVERLGDRKSAAICFQNAFALNPRYRPNLESARRLFAAVGQWDKVVALHEKEQASLKDPNQRAESLRAQAQILAHRIGQVEEAGKRVREALELSPEHPALLAQAIDAAALTGDRLDTARMLLRAAEAQRDDTQRAQHLRRAALLLEQLQAEAEKHAASSAGKAESPIADETKADALKLPLEELSALLEETLRKLQGADGKDPVGRFALMRRARAAGRWEEAHRLLKLHADRSAGAADRAAAARIMLHQIGRPADALSDTKIGLDESRKDPSLHALRTDLEALLGSPDTARALNERADFVADPTEKADLKVAAAARMADTYEREQLYSEALAANPGDAAAIALHVRAMAHRDAGDAADRFVALGEALADHAPDEASSNFLEAGMWLTRAGRDEEASALAQRVLQLFPDDPGALRLLLRTLPGIGKGQELSALLEDAASRAEPSSAVMLLLRAAAVVADYPAPEGGDDSQSGQTKALKLAEKAADLATGLPGIARGLETWFFLALRAADRKTVSTVMEKRADCAASTDEAADFLVEAAEMARSEKADLRAAELFRKARAVSAHGAPLGDDGQPSISYTAATARRGLLALPDLPAEERAELLIEEARGADTERAAALQAERAAILHVAGRNDEAAQACAQALALGGVDVAVLRRLARLQESRGDGAALLEVRLQIAQAVPEGAPRAEALCRAAEAAEWLCNDAGRAEQLYVEAAAHEQSPAILANLARLRVWSGSWSAAADAYELLAEKAVKGEKTEALRAAASLRAHRTGEPDKAIALYRKLLIDEPTDVEAIAELLAFLGADHGVEGRRERAELRGKLASRCQDPRVSAILRAEIAEDRFASGDRDLGLAEYRRALALNPQDRLSLDLVEEALRASGRRDLLASHLDFRCAYADDETRAALALQQGEILAEEGQLDAAANAYRQAMGSPELGLLAIRGARKIAERQGDKQEQMRLLSKEGSLVRDPQQAARALVAAAQLAEEQNDPEEARQYFASALDHDPSHPVAQAHLLELNKGNVLELVEHYEKIGSAHAVPRLAAVAWAQAARLRLHQMKDSSQAYVSAGRALKLDAECADALELRAEAGAESGREKEAIDSLIKRMAMPSAEAQTKRWKKLLGRLHVALGEPEKALPLLGDDPLDEIDLPSLAKGGPALAKAQPAMAAKIYVRLTEGYRPDDLDPLPEQHALPTASRAKLTEWHFALAEASEAAADPAGALQAYRRTVGLDPRHRGALEKVASLAAEAAPEEALAAHRTLLDMDVVVESALHAIFALEVRLGLDEPAFCAAAALVGLGLASNAEKAAHEAEASKALPAELPKLADGAVDRAPILAAGDEGAARELIALASPELPQVYPPDLAGKADRVKGDNPVRRVCAALSRALGAPETQLYVAKAQPSVVVPLATEPPGMLVGTEVPRRFPARQQRFLYGRALAHVRRGTHAIAALSPAALGQLVNELVRISAPPDSDPAALAALPPVDEALAAKLAEVLKPVVELQEDANVQAVDPKERLAPAAARLLSEPTTNWEALALSIRETAERAAMVICGDPSAAVLIVAQECGGGLEKPAVARLVRFAVSEEYAGLRAR